MYDLKSVDLPKLTGQALRLFASFIESRPGQALLLTRLLKDGGIIRFRAQRFDEPPTYIPLVSPQTGDLTEAAKAAVGTASPPKPINFPYKTATDFVDAYRSGITTPLAVAQAFLEAIDQLGAERPSLNCFIAIEPQDLLDQARASTARYQAGNPFSPLDGVPVAVKDELDMIPFPTTVGTSFWGARAATEDSTVVWRLREAGALLLGKTNMYEIGISPEGFNAHHGTVRNPFNLQHDSGGSSSGSAAAVGAGLCPIAIGADGGGSIRVPAAHCGLVGLKATYGRISGHGSAPLDWSVGHIGPLGVSVQDVLTAYRTIAGPDPGDSNTLNQPDMNLGSLQNTDLSELNIGIYSEWFDHANPEVVETCRRVVDAFDTAGARIQQIDIPQLDNMRIAHAITILSEMATSMQNINAQNRAFGAPTRVNLTLARAITARDYVHAQRMRTRALNIFKAIFADIDVIITPTTAVTAPPVPPNSSTVGWSNLSAVTELMRFVFVGNLTGVPAISFPVGYDSNGLPIGMQGMAGHWREEVLFRVAACAERLVERKKPSVWYNLLQD